MLNDIGKLIQKNFIEKVTIAAKQGKDMLVTQTKDFVLVDSGMPSDTYNVCVVLNDEIDNKSILEQAISYFKNKKYPMALWCWDFLKEFKTMLDKSQLTLGEINIGMYAETNTLNPNPIIPSNCFLKAVENQNEIKAYGNIITTLFGECLEGKCIKLYYDSLSEKSLQLNNPIKNYLGYMNGEAVCTGSAVFTRDSVGIYDIATLPEYRKHGLGSAMFHYILSDIKKNFNGLCVLQASEEGMGIYKKAGFESACNIYVYENRSLIE